MKKIKNSSLKCECGGELQLVEEVSGSFVYNIEEDNSFSWDNREFHGDSNTFVECKKCSKTYCFDFDYDPDTNKEYIVIGKQ